jgi:hypothetical protein
VKPVDQQHVDDVNGDCLQACVASIVELPLELVPKFSESGFMPAVEQWAKKTGRVFIWVDIPDFTSLNKIWFGSTPPFFIAWGESPRLKADGKAKQHCVVVKRKGYGVEVVHDPHQSRDGLKSMCGFGFIVGWRRGKGE